MEFLWSLSCDLRAFFCHRLSLSGGHTEGQGWEGPRPWTGSLSREQTALPDDPERGPGDHRLKGHSKRPRGFCPLPPRRSTGFSFLSPIRHWLTGNSVPNLFEDGRMTMVKLSDSVFKWLAGTQRCDQSSFNAPADERFRRFWKTSLTPGASSTNQPRPKLKLRKNYIDIFSIAEK